MYIIFCMDNHSMEINVNENSFEVDNLVEEFDARLSERKLVELESENYNLIITGDVDEEYEVRNIENYNIVNFEISGVSVDYNERYGRFFVEKDNEVVKGRLTSFLDGDYSVKTLPDVGDVAEVIKFDYQDKSYMVEIRERDVVKKTPGGDETIYDYRGEIVQNDNNRIGDEIFFYREHVV